MTAGSHGPHSGEGTCDLTADALARTPDPPHPAEVHAMGLISQPGSDYQLAQLALDAGTARDIMLMLLDVHAVLDHLYLDGTQPQVTAPAEDYLRESASPYTLPGLIGALSDVISTLTRAIRDADPLAGP